MYLPQLPALNVISSIAVLEDRPLDVNINCSLRSSTALRVILALCQIRLPCAPNTLKNGCAVGELALVN